MRFLKVGSRLYVGQQTPTDWVVAHPTNGDEAYAILLANRDGGVDGAPGTREPSRPHPTAGSDATIAETD